MDAKQKAEINSFLNTGLFAQYLGVIFWYCIKNDKKDYLERIKKLVSEFEASLGEEEKKLLGEDVENMMKEKADTILEEMKRTMSEEDIKQLLSEFKSA